MHPIFARISTFLSLAGAAAMVAFWLGYIAHYDLGFSRQEIRTPAVIAAGVIALLLAVEYFGTRLRKSK
jgi:tetrahydromethanopterin S-methyltransferase subunit C